MLGRFPKILLAQHTQESPQSNIMHAIHEVGINDICKLTSEEISFDSVIVYSEFSFV